MLRASKFQLPIHSKGHLSPSQISMYYRCPHQYYLRYVEGIKSPPGVALVEGSAHHAALEEDNNYYIKRGKRLPLKKVQKVFEERFADGKREIKKWWGEKDKDVIERGRIIQEVHRVEFSSHFQPEASEHEANYKIGDVYVKGIVDTFGTVDNKHLYTNPMKKIKSVVDYKTVSRKKTQDDLDNDFQLTHYGWYVLSTMKMKEPYVGFCCLMKDSFKSVWQPVLVTVSRIKWYRHIVLSVADAISRGSFPVRNPVGWECSEKFCGYYKRCKGKVYR